MTGRWTDLLNTSIYLMVTILSIENRDGLVMYYSLRYNERGLNIWFCDLFIIKDSQRILVNILHMWSKAICYNRWRYYINE